MGTPAVMAATASRAPRARAKLREFVDAYAENDLLTYASAISFQILSAIVPFLLFGFALLGFLHLQGVWGDDLAPRVKDSVSPAAFAFANEAIMKALTNRQLFWVTAGFLIALWEVSGAIRAVMGALQRVYGLETRRSWRRRMLVSTALALAVGACWLAAIAVVVVGPLLVGDVSGVLAVLLFVVRWAIAGLLLLLAVAILLHYAPERRSPLGWVTFGAVLIMAGWLLMSLGFGFYLREIADYNSIFGGLATVVVLIAYLYASAVVFLGGVQVDALVRPLALSRVQRSDERARVVAVGVQVAVDEEGRRGADPERLRGGRVALDAGGVGARRELGGDAVGVEPERARVRDEVGVLEAAAGGVQRVVHLPEGALGGRGLGGLGGVAGVRVDATRAGGGGRRSAGRRPGACARARGSTATAAQ